MIKLSKRISDGLKKVHFRRPKSKDVNGVTDVKAAPKKVKKQSAWVARVKLERSPGSDRYVQNIIDTPAKPSAPKPIEKPAKKVDKRNRLGDFLIQKNKQYGEAYKNDLDMMAQFIPEVTFFRSANETSAKELNSLLAKLEKRSEQFKERGFSGIIRDGVRARVFMPDADKNYGKIVDFMTKKLGYKVAMNFAEDAQGNIIKNADGTYKMIEDIDVRFGTNACKSGYEDVQIRFQKGNVLYELIILPGPNYMDAANKEHDVFENIKKYTNYNLDKDIGAKQIINGIREAFSVFSKRLYADALIRDKGGVKKITEPTTFTFEEVKNINALFKSLKLLYSGKFSELPPSKRYQKEFKDTKTFRCLDTLEQNLKKVVEFYKPIAKEQ